MKSLFLSLILLVFTSSPALAHCPLCTVGAAAAAGGAAFLGVSNIVIGLFIGAFAVSTGWWIARMIKKKPIPFQMPIVIFLSFITTVLPLMKLFPQIKPVFLSWMGEFGATYTYNPFFAGSLVGGFIVAIAPSISKKIGNIRHGRMIPYQGIILTFGLLIISGLLLQFSLRG